MVQNPMLAPVKMNVSDQEIAKLVEQYGGMTIAGVDDKAGYKAVYEARQVVKKTRVGLQKYGKDLREDAQAWAKKVIAEEKRLVAPLENLEASLQAEEDRIDAEKERIKAEAEAKEKARVQARIDRLAQYGFAIDLEHVTNLPDADFEAVVLEAKSAWETEQEEKAERERIAKEEAERLAAEQKAKDEELARLRKEAQEREAQQEEQRKKDQAREEMIERMTVAAIDQLSSYGVTLTRDEFNALTSEEYQSLLFQAKTDHASRLVKQERERIEREAKEKKEADRQAKEKAKLEAQAKAARLPDKEKLTAFAEQFKTITLPDLTTVEGRDVLNAFSARFDSLLTSLETAINAL